MTPRMLYETVKEMRHHQRAWHNRRSYDELVKAKECERIIDREIEHVEAKLRAADPQYRSLY